MKKNNTHYSETVMLAIGEMIVIIMVLAGFLVASLFVEVNFLGVIFGALLGAAVTVLNLFFLSLSVNRSVDKYLALRGSREMSDEEAAEFTARHSAEIQNAIKLSFIIRTVTILATLVAAFLLMDWFNPIATAIPILAYRAIITCSETVRAKFDKSPDPQSFISYSDEDEALEANGIPSAEGGSETKEKKESDE